MTDATASPSPPKLRYVHSYTDTRGKLHYVFRRKAAIKGDPGSPSSRTRVEVHEQRH